MKKGIIIFTSLLLSALYFNFAFARQGNDTTDPNVAAFRIDNEAYEQKIILIEDVTETVLINGMWVDVRYKRETTVECKGIGNISCLKGEVIIKDLEIIQ